MKGQKEGLSKERVEILNKMRIKEKEGAGVSKEQFLGILKDIDGQDQMKTLWGIDDHQFLMRRNMADWIRSRKNAGIEMLKQLNDQDFARHIFKAWDGQSRGYLTAQEFTEQLVGLGLGSDSKFI